MPVRKRSARKGKPLTKKEQAEIKALSDLNHSNYQIEQRTGISHHTIDKYLKDQEAYSDPQMQAKVNQIKEKEILDLTVLNVEAKQRLHEIAPRMNAIEAIALMDRTFQQLRLLEGKSTANVHTLTTIIEEAHKATTHVDKRTGHTTVDIEAEVESSRR